MLVASEYKSTLVMEPVHLFRELRVPTYENGSFFVWSAVEEMMPKNYMMAMVPIMLWIAAVGLNSNRSEPVIGPFPFLKIAI